MRTYRAVNLNVLWFLIALNTVIFIIQLITGGGVARNSELVYMLGLTPVLVSRQPWTLISNMFIHADFFHIIFNMLALYFLGSFLIRAVGNRTFLAVFFLGGLAGNIFYFVLAHLVLSGNLPLFFGNPFIPGIGASGGIFALAGTLAILVPRMPVLIFFIPIPMPLWIAIIILVFLSFLFSGIAWQAHLGGLFLGLIAGLISRKRRRVYYF